jgi:hypothetical protein
LSVNTRYLPIFHLAKNGGCDALFRLACSWLIIWLSAKAADWG